MGSAYIASRKEAAAVLVNTGRKRSMHVPFRSDKLSGALGRKPAEHITLWQPPRYECSRYTLCGVWWMQFVGKHEKAWKG